MTHRYYVPEMLSEGGPLLLPTSEAHHARKVMRVRVGDTIELFDGQGNVAAARIAEIDKREIVCDVEPARADEPASVGAATFGIGLPKGDRAKFLVEKLTELGVAHCTPLQCEHSPWAPSDGAIEKWQRAVVEACKQSGRNRLLQIDPIVSAGDWLSRPDAAGTLRLIAHPAAAAGGEHSVAIESIFASDGGAATKGRPIEIAVGPEGGFTSEEIAVAIDAGWQVVDLGRRVYRIETAAMVMAALAPHR